jgi:tetratricopeptide (TPR) repeat protein/predicted Ser/Thr protein kinase
MAELELARQALAAGLVDGEALRRPPAPSAPDRYELGDLLGSGGGGSVYRARDLVLDRPVALKFLRDASPADVERFRREARFAARLNDPAIVQVYELGEHEGVAFIAMQHVDGGNLREAELDARGVVGVVHGVARALHRAHAVGIVHRDIKPENILIDRSGHALLTDFGIARDLSGALGETMSSEGQIVGTPPLMPPEQALGRSDAVDARSDVYGLGATLYTKLAGRYPFVAGPGDGLVSVLHRVIHDEPPLLRALDPGVPRALEAIVMKCMAKDREARYPSMAAVAEELEAFLAGDKGDADASPWFRRLVASRPAAPPPPDPWRNMDDTRARLGMEIVRELAAWDADLYRVSGSLERSFERLDALRARLDELLTETPDAAWARFYRGVTLFRAGRLDEALEDMERAIDRVRNLAGAYFELGRLYLALYLRDQHQARQHISQSGIDEFLADARVRLGQARVAFGQARRLNGELEPWHERYCAAVERLADGDFAGCIAECDAILAGEPDLEEPWKLRGDAEALDGRDPFESYERAVTVRRSYYEALYALGEARLRRGDPPRARDAFERAMAIHAEHVPSRARLAETFLYDDADVSDLIEGEAIAAETAALEPRSYDAAVTLGRFRIELGRRTGDESWFDGAITALDGAVGLAGCQNRVNYLRTSATLARAELVRARGGDATTAFAAVLAECDRMLECDPGSTHWGEMRARCVSGESFGTVPGTLRNDSAAETPRVPGTSRPSSATGT